MIIKKVIDYKCQTTLDKQAFDAINDRFKFIIKPFYSHKIKIKGEQVWRFKWYITTIFKDAIKFSSFNFTKNDIKAERVYTLDIYKDNIIDYIV